MSADQANLERKAQLERVVLPLIAITSDAKWHPIGTAFVVRDFGSQPLLITATHNLKEVVRLDEPNNDSENIVCPVFRIKPPDRVGLLKTRYYVMIEGNKGFVLAQIAKSWHLNEFDIAISVAQLEPASGAEFTSRIMLDTTPARVGENVNGIGYIGMSAKNTSDYERDQFHVLFSKRLEGRSGKVIDVARQGIGIHKWPGFIVDFPLDSGMSGGPILDTTGEFTVVRGVIGGDVSEGDNAEKGSGAQAFASMLWPALATAVEIRIQDESKTVLADTIIDLVRHDLIQDRGSSLKCFSRKKVDSGELIGWVESSKADAVLTRGIDEHD